MRILYASERPPYPLFLGGAARCAHQLLHVMADELDVECAAVGSADYAVSSWAFPQPEEHVALGVRGIGALGSGTIDCGYPVQVISDFENSLSNFIDVFKPDVVWAQLEGAREVLELARDKSILGLFYVHDAEFDPAELRDIANLDCHIVCSSGFLAEKVRKAIGRPVHVIYPASEWYFGTRSDTQGFVTMINPYQVKGIETLLEIAKRLPQEKFLLVESWQLSDAALTALKSRLALLPNVRFSHRVSDMRTIYAQTRLLLVPSMWEEGFGMVAIEAQSCGIPVIASARGGLVESVGDGGRLIDDYRNVERWLEAIQQVLNEQSTYTDLSEQAYQHAASDDFDPSHLAQQFAAICASGRPASATLSTRITQSIERVLRKTPLIHQLLR